MTEFSHIVEIHPLEAGIMEVHLIERGVRAVQAVQFAHQGLQLAMGFEFQQFPAQAGIVVPLLALADLLPHEQQLLARDAPTCRPGRRARWRTAATRRPAFC